VRHGGSILTLSNKRQGSGQVPRRGAFAAPRLDSFRLRRSACIYT
jgi:hypothetical protein